MQEIQTPYFNIGRVVKKESLDALRDYPRDLIHLMFYQYSDGILGGFDISSEDGLILVSDGAVRYLGEVILVNQERIEFQEYNQVVSVKLIFGAKKKTIDFEGYSVEIQVNHRLELSENEFELGRFCFVKGAVLRSDYKGVEDFRTYYNTLDITHVCYAGVEQATVSSKLLMVFGEELLQSDMENELDLSFGMQCMSGNRIPRKLILFYVGKRLKEGYHERSNEEIWECFLRIVRDRTKKEMVNKTVVNQGPRIM